MPIFIASIGGMLINLVGTLVGRVLVALGISVVTYTGIKASLDYLQSQAVGSFSSLPSGAMEIISLMRVGQCISIVTSAIAVRLMLDGLSSDTFKRWVYK